MQFSSVVGQSGLKRNLVDMAAGGRVGHAVMFAGGEGCGGLTLALAYAAYVMCERPVDGDSCGQCVSCVRHNIMQHPDCHYVFPVNTSKLAVGVSRSDSKPVSDMFLPLWRQLVEDTDGYFSEQELYRHIGIENMQGNINKSEASEILRKMSFKSFSGGAKVVIMWLPERLHEAAANALLKLVEEPAAGTVFVFVSQDLDYVLPTIRSRCQIIQVGGIAESDVRDALMVRYGGVSADVVDAAARVSCGSWVAAVAALNSSTSLSPDTTVSSSASETGDNVTQQNIERFQALMRLCYADKYIELFDWAESMVPLGRETQKLFCQSSIAFLRQCYMINIGMERISYTEARHLDFARRFAPYVNHASLEGLVREFENLLAEIRQNGNPKILFPHFALMVSKLIRR